MILFSFTLKLLFYSRFSFASVSTCVLHVFLPVFLYKYFASGHGDKTCLFKLKSNNLSVFVLVGENPHNRHCKKIKNEV